MRKKKIESPINNPAATVQEAAGKSGFTSRRAYYAVRRKLFEQLLRELVQGFAPGLPLMGARRRPGRSAKRDVGRSGAAGVANGVKRSERIRGQRPLKAEKQESQSLIDWLSAS